jgi:protein gp37
MARERAKMIAPIITTEIEETEAELKDVANSSTLSEAECTLSAAVLTEKLAALHRHRFRSARLTGQIHNRLEGKVLSKYWSIINKTKEPRELINCLLVTQKHSIQHHIAMSQTLRRWQPLQGTTTTNYKVQTEKWHPTYGTTP